jgi:thiol-disulfide isomerase/thioredoxin
MVALEMKDSDFDESGKIKKNKPGLLLVKAEWCGHCKRYKSTYSKLAKMFPPKGDFLITQIDETQIVKDSNAEKGLKNFIEGYPTLLFFNKDGKIVQRFDGDRENLSEMLKKICSMYKVCKKSN